jgi:CHAD domain-containing protein
VSTDVNFAVEGGTLEALLAALNSGFATRVVKAPVQIETYYDTFDWRLYRKNASLVCQRRRSGFEARLTTPDRRLEGEFDAAPRFVRDLPAGVLREALGPLASIRRLMPVVRVRRRARTVQVLNEDGKIVGRVGADELGVARPGTRTAWKTVKPGWTLRPLRGYGAETKAIGKILSRLPDVQRDSRSELDRLLAAIDCEAEGYTSKFQIDLEAREPAGPAVRRVLFRLVDNIRANQDGTIRDLDSEYLHQFRISVRRTRSCIGQMKATLPADRLEPFRKEFAWLGAITGPTRDLDVLLIDLDHWTDGDEAWAPLFDLVHREQRHEQKKMAARLRTRRYCTLLADWSAFLDSEPVAGEAPEAERPIVDVASEIIARRYKRMVTRGRKLNPRRATDALHRLRIDGKKLRYLLEFFRSAFPPQKADPAFAALKRLQDNLGEFNDLRVQQTALPLFARRLGTKGKALTDTHLLIGRLLERLARRERRVRRNYHGEFKHFASDEFARLIG